MYASKILIALAIVTTMCSSMSKDLQWIGEVKMSHMRGKIFCVHDITIVILAETKTKAMRIFNNVLKKLYKHPYKMEPNSYFITLIHDGNTITENSIPRVIIDHGHE